MLLVLCFDSSCDGLRICLENCGISETCPPIVVAGIGVYSVRFGRSRYCCGIATAILVALLAVSGCASGGSLFSPQWAMDNEDYARQYGVADTHPHRSNTLRKLSRMSQQMVDARFQKGQTGAYASAGVATRHRTALAGEIGLFGLPTSWSTVRIGAVGLLADGLPTYMTGGVAGARFHAPTRLSPYIGLSGMAGYSELSTTAKSSYFDNNGNFIQSGDKIIESSAILAAVIPEAGVSYWLIPQARLNLGASYYVTTSGRSQDFLLMGLSLEVIPGLGRDHPEARVHTASPELEQVIESEPYFKAEQDREAFENSIHVYEGGQVLPPEVPGT